LYSCHTVTASLFWLYHSQQDFILSLSRYKLYITSHAYITWLCSILSHVHVIITSYYTVMTLYSSNNIFFVDTKSQL